MADAFPPRTEADWNYYDNYAYEEQRHPPFPAQPQPKARRGCLIAIDGPMFSGKSTELLTKYRWHQQQGCAVVLIRHASDVRYCICSVATHDGVQATAHCVDALGGAMGRAATAPADIVCIDEGQFFAEEDLSQACEDMIAAGKTVIVAGLDTNYRREPFPSMKWAVTAAQACIRKRGKCRACGQPSVYTARITVETENVVVGADNHYAPACLKCHPLLSHPELKIQPSLA